MEKYSNGEGPSPSDSSWYLSKKELAAKLNLPSTRMVDELMRKGKIPFTKLGHRTVRFYWPKVLTAIGKLDHNAYHGHE